MDNSFELKTFEVKLDKTIAYLREVKDIKTLLRIMEALGMTPTENLDIRDRRAITRALTNYLNDERRLSDPQFGHQCDEIIGIEREYFRRLRESVDNVVGRVKNEMPLQGGWCQN